MGGKRIVIIGGVACGPKAAARARRLDPAAEITIVERGGFLSYAGCGMPYFISGVVQEIEDLMRTGYGAVRDAEFFRRVKKVTVLSRTEAMAIDRPNHRVKFRRLADGGEGELIYDQLVLATGAVPVQPGLPGMELRNVLVLRRPEEAMALRRRIEAGEAEHICVVGAGRIGLELAEAFANQAVETTLVDVAEQVLPGMFDPEMAEMVAKAVAAEGVKIYLGEKVKGFEGEDGRVKKVVTERREIKTDAVLVAVGVRPDTALARSAGLEIGGTGAIAVDDHLRTSDPAIFAGGDCTESMHLVTGKKVWAPLGSTANRQGRVIGDNLAGKDSVFPGVLGTGVLRTLGINAGATGITETQARELGYDPVSCLSPSGDRSHFYPGGKMIVIKLVADRQTRRLLGGQVAGPGDILRRLDAISATLHFRGTIDDLAGMDLAYAPPFGTAIEAVSHAANIVRNKMEGRMEGLPPQKVRAALAGDENFVILDLRDPAEIKTTGRFDDPRWKHIPIEELRERIAEIPPDRPVFAVCQVGQRSYEASCTLRGAGFNRVKVLEGGMAFYLRTGKVKEG